MTLSTLPDRATVLVGDVLARLADLPDESVHCVVTSPPYFALRDYCVPGQIGLEARIGVDPSQMCRFIEGRDIGGGFLERLESWMAGETMETTPPVSPAPAVSSEEAGHAS